MITTRTGSSADVYSRLAMRIRAVVREEHANTGTGAERFTVHSVSPLVLQHLGSDLVLTEGDPDFTVGAWVRQYALNYALATGDQVWCLREGQDWHVIDIADPGGQAAI